MLRIAASFVAGAGIGLLAGLWASPAEPARSASDSPGLESVLREDRDRLAARIGGQIEDLRRHVEALPLPARSSTPHERSAVAPVRPPETGGEAAGRRDLEARFDRLEQGLASLAKAIETHRQLVTYPAASQLRAALRAIDWALIARVSDAMCRDHDEGLALVRYLTFDEVLERFGAPTTINADGNWFYERPEGQTLGPEDFELDFVNGYVVQLHSSDE